MRERPIIFVSGCFDILHPGHVRFLKAAKEQGRTLVVGLNSDASIQKLKGHPPLLGQDARREILLSIKYVDEVIIFDEDKPWKLVSEIDPYAWLKGPDHKRDVAGPPREEPFYSSVILEKLKKRQFENVVVKTWGKEYWLVNEKLYCAKLLEVTPRFSSSLHMHQDKTETFIGISGDWLLEHERTWRIMSPGDRATIQPSERHRFSTKDGATILEVSSHHSDEDVTRYEKSRVT